MLGIREKEVQHLSGHHLELSRKLARPRVRTAGIFEVGGNAYRHALVYTHDGKTSPRYRVPSPDDSIFT